MPRAATDTRERILNAARDLFGERGVDATSIREIARTAGVNLGMIHYFFKTKDNLVDAVLERYFGNVAEALDSVPAAGTPREKLAAAIRAIISYIQDNQSLVRIVMREYSLQTPRIRQIGARFLGPNFVRLAMIVSEGVGGGRFKPLDVRFLSMATLGMMVHPFMVRPLLAQVIPLDFTSKEFAERLATTVETVLFEGIEAPSRVPRKR